MDRLHAAAIATRPDETFPSEGAPKRQLEVPVGDDDQPRPRRKAAAVAEPDADDDATPAGSVPNASPGDAVPNDAPSPEVVAPVKPKVPDAEN